MATIEINERPLKMPENYDFSTRKVNWKSYKDSYILRTDAVWEKHKLYAYFYKIYKYDKWFHEDGKYYDITWEYAYEVMDAWEDPKIVKDLIGKDDDYVKPVRYHSAGAPWQFDLNPVKIKPVQTSRFTGDRTRDGTFLCLLRYYKFMRCNEKSYVKLTEASFANGTYEQYPCFDDLKEMDEVCILFHWKFIMEMYYFRTYNNYYKPISQQRVSRKRDMFYAPESAQKLYY